MSYRDVLAALREADGALKRATAQAGRLEDERASLELRVAELEAQLAGSGGGGTGPVDPVPGDSPSFVGLPFAHLMPAWTPYTIPTELQCHWIVAGREATHVRTGHVIQADADGGVAGHCYRHSIKAGDPLPVVIGVRDNLGPARAGGQWGPDSGRSITVRRQDGGFDPIRVQIVGLSDEAEVQLGWTNEYGYPAEVGAFNIGLRGATDAMVIRANEPSGGITLDGCWLLAADGTYHEQGIHTDEWERLVIRRLKWRGKRPTDPGIKLQQHPIYLKSSRGETWLVGNDLRGGNRTGCQIRPGRDDASNPRPRGPVVLLDNVADGFGWTHGDTAASADGGAVLSVWASPDAPVFIARNRITDARYGCLNVGGQGPERNWLNARGFPIAGVYVAGNTFTNARGDRQTISVTGAEALYWWDDNAVSGAAILNDEWGIQHHGIRNGAEVLIGATQPSGRWQTFDGKRTRDLTATELMAIRTTALPVAGGPLPL